ncbi:hypothetical protein, partial [Lottiidibacillus patelloidae]|uniref:hypothetical protein n=1 Tax=Lottiidibacillus patelloidae TaxID=2670334 RepID=UPI001E46B056
CFLYLIRSIPVPSLMNSRLSFSMFPLSQTKCSSLYVVERSPRFSLLSSYSSQRLLQLHIYHLR